MNIKRIILAAILLTNFCIKTSNMLTKSNCAIGAAVSAVVGPLVYDYFTNRENIGSISEVLPKDLLIGFTVAAALVNTANHFIGAHLAVKLPKMGGNGTFFTCAAVSVLGSFMLGYALKYGKFGFQPSTNKFLIFGPALGTLGLNGFILYKAL